MGLSSPGAGNSNRDATPAYNSSSELTAEQQIAVHAFEPTPDLTELARTQLMKMPDEKRCISATDVEMAAKILGGAPEAIPNDDPQGGAHAMNLTLETCFLQHKEPPNMFGGIL